MYTPQFLLLIIISHLAVDELLANSAYNNQALQHNPLHGLEPPNAVVHATLHNPNTQFSVLPIVN